MLKEQNVIKLLLTITFFCLSINLYCQKKIVGKFSNLMLHQEHYNYFVFNDKGIFEYHSGADLGDDEYGKGHYQIKNDSLILNYDLTDLKENSYHKYKRYINSLDSIKLKVTITDFKNKPIPNVNVYSFKNKYGVITNKEGIAFLSLKKEIKGMTKIEVSELCCDKYSFLINNNFNYEIVVFLNKEQNKPSSIKHEILKYKIVEQTDDFIKLKNTKGIIKLVKQSK